MARSPGFGARAGLPAGLLGRADAGQRSLILVPQMTKGSTLWAGQLSLEVHESSCNCIFMCVCERLCQLFSLIYVFILCVCVKTFILIANPHVFLFLFLTISWIEDFVPRLHLPVPNFVSCLTFMDEPGSHKQDSSN